MPPTPTPPPPPLPPAHGALEASVADAAQARVLSLSVAERRRRGVVHTPPALARAALRMADRALREQLGLEAGLASPRLQIVDPAIGPGAFLAAALSVAADRSTRPRSVLGLDLDEAAIRIAREQLGPAFAAAGWPLALVHKDTLASLELEIGESEPSGEGAARPPSAGPLLVIGNPPWASRSANRGSGTEALLEDFRRDEEGRPLGERKIGVLSDDYVRFFRWAAEQVRRRPEGGALALITNGSFIDGPVHRGMRACLRRWFDGIDLIDLGGNGLLARRGGARDENLFGVRPGVALTVAWRRPSSDAPLEGRRPERIPARLRHLALRGSRAEKLLALERDPALTAFEAEPQAPFRPIARAAGGYAAWPSIDTLFPFHREGVQTNRDAVVIDRDPERLLARISAFARGEQAPGLEKASVALPHYDPERARRAAAEALAAGVGIEGLAYRPFDARFFFPIAPLTHRPRPALREALAHAPLALLSVRKDRGSTPWTHAAMVGSIPDNCYLSSRSSCRTRAFPLRDPSGRPNVDRRASRALEEGAGRSISPHALLRYALLVLGSQSYQRLFDVALHLDYPRLPPPLPDLWGALEQAGERLEAAFLRPAIEEGERLRIGHRALDRLPAGLREALREGEALVGELLGRQGLRPPSCDLGRGVGADEA